MHSAAFEEPRSEAQPDGGIVVAACEDYLGTGPGQAHQCVVKQPDDVDSGQGAVVDVTGDEDDVHGFVAGRKPRAGQ